MHPAPSIIAFTSLSGLGFGYLFFLGLGVPLFTGGSAFIAYAIAYALAVGGLISSTFHLGNPQRAIKAFSQWRTSWLSREGIISVVTLLVMGLYAAAAVFLGQIYPLLGAIGAVLCMFTIICTAMIYAQMKTVPRWNQALTPVLFVLFAVTGGALLAGQVWLAARLMLLLSAAQALHWFLGDRRFAQVGSSLGTATGLGDLGRVRLLEPPHTGPNYLLHEMAYSVGRKHAATLRVIALLTIGILPFLILTLTPAGHVTGAIALLMHVVGLMASRWLFFAEAEHVQALYYGHHGEKTA